MINLLQVSILERDYSGFLITSDGIHDYLDEEVLEDFIAECDYSEQSFERLIQKAKDSGSSDDKSILLIMIRE